MSDRDYELHIENFDGAKIPEDDWRAAVAKVECVRLTATAPEQLGDGPESSSHAEVHFPDSDEWRYIFRWTVRGRISFPTPDDWDSSKSRVRDIAEKLATSMGCGIVGDGGEVYME